MSVESFVAGDRFRITIIKYLAANPDRKWGNNYELRAKAGGGVTDLTNAGSKLVDFEQAIHMTPVQFDRLRMSTWEADSVPYDPTAFVSLPLSGTGDSSPGASQVAAINVCWDVARVPLSGRFGHIFYRACLTESRIEAPAGKYVLSDPAGMTTIVNTEVASSGIDAFMDDSDPTWELVMINADGTQTRNLIGLISRGVAVVPFDHAWFNRT